MRNKIIIFALMILSLPAMAQPNVDRAYDSIVHTKKISVGPLLAAAKPLLIESAVKYLWQQVKERGMICSTVSMDGTFVPCSAIKTLVWNPGKRGEIWTLAIGGNFADINGVIAIDNINIHVASPFNLIELLRPIYESEKFRRNFDHPKIPGGLELWIGPSFISTPKLQFKNLSLKKNLGGYFSLGKKFGGAPAADKE